MSIQEKSIKVLSDDDHNDEGQSQFQKAGHMTFPQLISFEIVTKLFPLYAYRCSFRTRIFFQFQCLVKNLNNMSQILSQLVLYGHTFPDTCEI